MVSGAFLEPSKSRNSSSRSSDFSNFHVICLKTNAERARFKTAKNPTSQRPSESTQEALNSLLAMGSSHFEQFSKISTKILKFSRGSSQEGPAQSRTLHVPPPTRGGSWIFRFLRPDFWKKVLREPGSNRPKIYQKWRWSETIGID